MISKDLEKSKRVAALGASALVAAAMIPVAALAPNTAYAETVTQTLTWHDGQPQPAVPQTIVGSNGQTLTLQSQTRPVQASGSATMTQDFTQTATGVATDVAAVPTAVPATFHINSDGYNGDIPRIRLDYVPVNRTDKIHYEDDQSGSPANSEDAARDANHLPAYIYNSAGAKLSLVSSTVSVYRTNTAGDPILWIANGHYVYDDTKSVFDHFAVTATYSGRLTKSVNTGDWSISMVYTGPDSVEENNDQPAPDVKKTSYVIHYYKEGTVEEVSPSQKVENQPVDGEVIATAIEVNGYTLVGDREQKMKLIDGNNEINFYYKADENAQPEDNANNNAVAPVVANKNNNNNNEPIEEPADDKEDGNIIPILPIAIAGAVALVGIIGGIVIVKGRKKKNQPQDVEAMPVVAAAGIIGEDFEDDEALYAAPAAAVIAGGLFDDYEPESQLIEVVPREVEDALGNITVDYDQIPKAQLEILPSVAEEIPTILYLPRTTDEEGNRITTFVPADNAQYWIAIDEETADRAVSKDIIVASSEFDEIFRGSLADEEGNVSQQLLLDGTLLVAALNGTLAEGQTQNVYEELTAYEERRDAIVIEQREAAQAAAMEEVQTTLYDDDAVSFEDELDFENESGYDFENEMAQSDEEAFADFDSDEGDFDIEDELEDDFEDEFVDADEYFGDEDEFDIEDELDDYDAFADIAEPDHDGGYEGEDGFANYSQQIEDVAVEDEVPGFVDYASMSAEEVEETIVSDELVEADDLAEEIEDFEDFEDISDEVSEEELVEANDEPSDEFEEEIVGEEPGVVDESIDEDNAEATESEEGDEVSSDDSFAMDFSDAAVSDDEFDDLLDTI